MQVAPVADRIAALWILDLDDLGTELGEHARRKRPGDQGSEFDYLDSRQRPGHGQTPSRKIVRQATKPTSHTSDRTACQSAR